MDGHPVHAPQNGHPYFQGLDLRDLPEIQGQGALHPALPSRACVPSCFHTSAHSAHLQAADIHQPHQLVLLLSYLSQYMAGGGERPRVG